VFYRSLNAKKSSFSNSVRSGELTGWKNTVYYVTCVLCWTKQVLFSCVHVAVCVCVYPRKNCKTADQKYTVSQKRARFNFM